MNVIVVNGKENKGMEEAIKLLKENGFDVYSEMPLITFLKEEAAFGLDNEIALYEDQQEIYNNMSPEDQQSLTLDVAQAYLDDENIFDYDVLDDIARGCFREFHLNKEEE